MMVKVGDVVKVTDWTFSSYRDRVGQKGVVIEEGEACQLIDYSYAQEVKVLFFDDLYQRDVLGRDLKTIGTFKELLKDNIMLEEDK